MQDSLELLSSICMEMLHSGYRSCWVVLNKQDSVSPKSIGDIEKEFELKLKEIFNNSIRCRVIDYPVSTQTGEGVKHIMDDLCTDRTRREKSDQKATVTEQSRNPSEKRNESANINLERQIQKDGANDIMDSQEFWHMFLNAEVMEWGHRDHLKSGYILTLESFKEGRTVFDTAETFIGHLRRLREARPDSFRNTEHRYEPLFEH